MQVSVHMWVMYLNAGESRHHVYFYFITLEFYVEKK